MFQTILWSNKCTLTSGFPVFGSKGHISVEALLSQLGTNFVWPLKDKPGVFDRWFCELRCVLVAYWAILVRQRDTSFTARAEESVPDLLPMWVTKIILQRQTIHTYARLHACGCQQRIRQSTETLAILPSVPPSCFHSIFPVHPSASFSQLAD